MFLTPILLMPARRKREKTSALYSRSIERSRGVPQYRLLFQGTSQLLYPNACLICGSPEADGAAFRHGLCSGCRRDVSEDQHEVCTRCAATVGPHAEVANGCPACREIGHGFDRAVRFLQKHV